MVLVCSFSGEKGSRSCAAFLHLTSRKIKKKQKTITSNSSKLISKHTKNTIFNLIDNTQLIQRHDDV